MPLGTEVAQSTLCSMRTQLCSTGTQLPREKGARLPLFLAHDYCGQTAGCINMPFAKEVNLGTGDFVLDGTQLPPPQKKGQSPHTFNVRLMSIVAKRLDG